MDGAADANGRGQDKKKVKPLFISGEGKECTFGEYLWNNDGQQDYQY